MFALSISTQAEHEGVLHVRDVCEVKYGTLQQGGFYSCWV